MVCYEDVRKELKTSFILIAMRKISHCDEKIFSKA